MTKIMAGRYFTALIFYQLSQKSLIFYTLNSICKNTFRRFVLKIWKNKYSALTVSEYF